MNARVVLAAIAAGMMGLVVPDASAQSGAERVRPRVCAGDCPEDKAALERELSRARAELARLAAMLAQGGDSLDPSALASVRTELSRAMRTMERLEMQTRERQAATVMMRRAPMLSGSLVREGWLGVSFSATFEVMERSGQPRLFRFMAYPVVESVEPASPARRAGIEVGDVLLAFKEKDLRQEPIALEEMLSPGTRLPVKFRRGAGIRTVVVTVGERPRGTYVAAEPVRGVPPAPLSPVPATAGVRRPPSAAPPSPPAPNIWVYSTSEAIPLAGAEMARLPVQLRSQVGATHGLLVLEVGHGTPLARAGLREGDVIVSANGAVVRSLGDLQLAIRRARESVVSLEVVRERQTMTMKMAWGSSGVLGREPPDRD
jgi:membrane-associated protease RseP (regulator of RpoE activity)